MFSIYKLTIVYDKTESDDSPAFHHITHVGHFNSFDGANRFMHSIKASAENTIRSVSIKLIIVDE